MQHFRLCSDRERCGFLFRCHRSLTKSFRTPDTATQRRHNMSRSPPSASFSVYQMFVVSVVLFAFLQVASSQPYKHQRCSNRLEHALEHMHKRGIQLKGSRSLWNNAEMSPYQLYHSFYGQHSEPEDDFYGGGGGDFGTGSASFDANDRGYHAKHINRNQRPAHAPTGDIDLEDLFATNTADNIRQPHKLAISRVDVEELKVRVPPSKSAATRWVEIDKCKFSIENSTLDTRLIFPDLTLSGKVVLQPAGGKCNMILRLRHAGIEFRTIPIGFETATNEESRRLGAASVRTDSHFAEPGFISVFAHGCQGPSGIRLRQNSKRRFGFASGNDATHVHPPEVSLSEPQVVVGTTTSQSTNSKRWGKYHKPTYNRPNYDIRSGSYLQQPQRDLELDFKSNERDSYEFYDLNGDNFYRQQFRERRRRRRDLSSRKRRQYYAGESSESDEMHFNDDILNFSDDRLRELVQPDARAFADIFSADSSAGSGNREDFVNNALSSELEKLFSMGVRGLLTTYMQRALQPAIKETLMENMGYTLSYG